MRIVMMGTGTFAEPTFNALLASPHQVVGLVTQPDRVIGQERGSTRRARHGMKELAIAHRVPVFQPESINTPQGVEGLHQFGPELVVVAAYGQILSREVLSVAPHGGINVHASLLPKYRGAAPVAWAIYHGESRTGVSIIKMSIYLDAGEILDQGIIDIGLEETAGELEARLAPLGGDLAVRVVGQIAAGTAAGVKQDKSQATRAPKLTKEDGLIAWGRGVDQVCNQIRAMQPWPTAYTYLHRAGQQPLRIIVHRACAFETWAGDISPPGQLHVLPETPHVLLVWTGSGLAKVLEVQPAGKRRMPAVDFLRGHPVQAGDRFGSEVP
jgi:methionyl-tRNA formyltransferase